MVTREQLYDQVWSAPMTKVAEQYAVSGTYLARVCSALNVPRPPTGYWAKLAVGKAPAIELLPAAQASTQLAWNENDGPLPAPSPPRPRAPRMRHSTSRASVPATDVHPLIRSTRAEFMRSRPVEHGGYLKPYKKLLPGVSASVSQIDRALGLAGRLYNELEAVGARVAIAPGDQHWHWKSVDEREVPQKDRQYSYHSSSAWSPMRPTVAFFDEAAIAIAVVEMSAEIMLRYVGNGYIRETEYQANIRRYRYQHTFTTTAELPIGRIRVFASASNGVNWSMSWQEHNELTLETQLSRIAKEIRAAIPVIVEKVAEARRQAEIRHQEWLAAEDRRKRQEDRRRIDESTNASKEALGQVIDQWKDRMAVERFFEELSNAIGGAPEPERTELVERLQLAKEFMGTADPLDFFRAWKTPLEIYRPIFNGDPSR